MCFYTGNGLCLPPASICPHPMASTEPSNGDDKGVAIQAGNKYRLSSSFLSSFNTVRNKSDIFL